MSNFFKSIFPYLAGAGASGVASQFSALSPFQAAIGAGAGALSNSKNRLAGALQGFAGGGVGSSLAGGVKNMFTGQGSNMFDKFGSGAMSGLKSFGGSIPGFGGVGTSNPTGAFAKFFSGGGGSSDPNSVLKNGTQYYKPNAAGTGYDRTSVALPSASNSFTPTASGMGGSTPAGAMRPMDMFKNMVPGMAVAGLGSMLAPKVDAPDYSGIKNDLMNKMQAGGNPEARAAAMKYYLDTVGAPTGASAEAGVANAKLINDRQRAQAIKDLQQQFSANNGSLNGNSAYNEALAKTNAYYDQNYASQAAETQFRYDQQQQINKQAAAQALQGMDDSQLKFYASLADLDIMQIQEKLGIDVESANSIKTLAGVAGSLMMQKGLGL